MCQAPSSHRHVSITPLCAHRLPPSAHAIQCALPFSDVGCNTYSVFNCVMQLKPLTTIDGGAMARIDAVVALHAALMPGAADSKAAALSGNLWHHDLAGSHISAQVAEQGWPIASTELVSTTFEQATRVDWATVAQSAESVKL